MCLLLTALYILPVSRLRLFRSNSVYGIANLFLHVLLQLPLNEKDLVLNVAVKVILNLVMQPFIYSLHFSGHTPCLCLQFLCLLVARFISAAPSPHPRR